MTKNLGTVISSFESPSSSQFDFVVQEKPGKVPVRKGQFIQLQTEEGILIGRVEDVIKTNRYFMQAESVREYEKSGNPLHQMFPVERWEYLVAKTHPLGVYEKGVLRRVTYPPSPGSVVKEIDTSILSEFLGLDKNGLNIGQIALHGLDARINLTKLFQKHLAILAMSGSGKSYLCGILLEELLDRSEELGKPAIIIIDPHGEYKNFTNDKSYADRTKVFESKNISIAASSLTPYQIGEFMPQMSAAQHRELAVIIDELRKKKRSYGFDELLKAIKKSDTKVNIKETLVRWLSNLRRRRLFSNISRPTISQLAKGGQLSILDISDIINLKDKQMIVTYFARKLFNQRRQGKIPPFVLIMEEAHQFCPEKRRAERSISKSIIETIAREGRKFHASLVLISQRPVQLSTTALSQCNTHIILRVTNPYDLDHISKSSEGITSGVLRTIPGLKVGEALIVGEAVNHPLLVKIRERKSKDSDRGIRLEDVLLKYTAKLKKKSKDMETFM